MHTYPAFRAKRWRSMLAIMQAGLSWRWPSICTAHPSKTVLGGHPGFYRLRKRRAAFDCAQGRLKQERLG
jgi:hypothetical protein